MEPDAFPMPHPQTAARLVDGQAVVILADSGLVNVLNEVGSRVWELADGQHTAAQIVGAIVSEYEVSREEAESDVMAFLQHLLEVHALTLDTGQAQRAVP
jgi:hypothetical protein